MAMNDDLMIKNFIVNASDYAISRDEKVEYEVDSFDFGDRFEMDFDAGF